MSQPFITVLLPVFNADKYIHSSLRSVVRQSFKDFEILVIDDGSSDETVNIINSFDDSRIRLVKNRENRGVASTLNKGLSLAKGKYIARMDADDICYPERLESQIQFMEDRPEVGVAGSWVKYFGNQPPLKERLPNGAETLKAYLLFDNPLYHPSVMIRKDLFTKHDLRYDPVFNRSEDYELWIRASKYCAIDNIPKALLRYRCHNESVTSTTSLTMKEQTCKLQETGLKRFGLCLSQEELLFHYSVSKGERQNSVMTLSLAEQWLTKLVHLNDRGGGYPEDSFLRATGMIWFRLCQRSSTLGMPAWGLYHQSLLSKGYRPPVQAKILFLMSVLVNKFPRT